MVFAFITFLMKGMKSHALAGRGIFSGAILQEKGKPEAGKKISIKSC